MSKNGTGGNTHNAVYTNSTVFYMSFDIINYNFHATFSNNNVNIPVLEIEPVRMIIIATTL